MLRAGCAPPNAPRVRGVPADVPVVDGVPWVGRVPPHEPCVLPPVVVVPPVVLPPVVVPPVGVPPWFQ